MPAPWSRGGCKSPLTVAEGVAGKPGCRTLGRKSYFRHSSQGSMRVEPHLVITTLTLTIRPASRTSWVGNPAISRSKPRGSRTGRGSSPPLRRDPGRAGFSEHSGRIGMARLRQPISVPLGRATQGPDTTRTVFTSILQLSPVTWNTSAPNLSPPMRK